MSQLISHVFSSTITSAGFWVDHGTMMSSTYRDLFSWRKDQGKYFDVLLTFTHYYPWSCGCTLEINVGLLICKKASTLYRQQSFTIPKRETSFSFWRRTDVKMPSPLPQTWKQNISKTNFPFHLVIWIHWKKQSMIRSIS